MVANKKHVVIPRVSCFVFYKDEILLIKVNDTSKPYFGKYFPLGGHIEKGEGVIETAIREIEEESGIKTAKIQIRVIIHQTNFYGKDIMWFVTESFVKSKNVVESEDGTLHWVKVKEIKKYGMPGNVSLVIDNLRKMKDGQLLIGTSKFDGKDKFLFFDVTIQ